MAGPGATSIALPQGGGALRGIGETFTPDLHTGTGNFSIPIALPAGRNGLQPELSLLYSSGRGNGPFGLGWSLSVPGVSRKTSHGVPRYADGDVFLLSGAEDLVPVEDVGQGITRYRPRTEGLFAQIHHHRGAGTDHWEVATPDGLVSQYGTPGSAGQDPAAVADPAARGHVCTWWLSSTRDPFGNRIEYEYERDLGQDGAQRWDQLYLRRVRYADYTEGGENRFLVSVTFEYADRPDPFSDHRSGFEVRTRRRCARVAVRTHAGQDRLVRVHHLGYLDERASPPPSGVSLLSQVRVVGHDGAREEERPPIELGYTAFTPADRRFAPVSGMDLPAESLAHGHLALVDLFGQGLPDLLEMGGTARYWRNLGNAEYALPRPLAAAPAGLTLADPAVQLVDADGDGRTDLLVATDTRFGYYPLRGERPADGETFRSYRSAPSFDLADPEVKLADLDGDGVVDVIRSGTSLECYFNDAEDGWRDTLRAARQSIPAFPDVSFADPRVRLADMTGDGLSDIVLLHDGNLEYWPSLGHGRWAPQVHMRRSPRFPLDYDPARVLLGDVDGDGAADIVYVEDTRVTLWVNQGGHAWSDPLVVEGTPPVGDIDALRLVDLLGRGVSGLLWSKNAGVPARDHLLFLDFTGGIKPYLLDSLDNQIGAVTRVEYAPSTRFYLADERRPQTRWRAPLPFPVQVVARSEVRDLCAGTTLTTEYTYHHGYWDGQDREFRGFGRVDQTDTEAFAGQPAAAPPLPPAAFSPPTETRTWFHLGPVGTGGGDWEEVDLRGEFWAEDPPALARPAAVTALLAALPGRGRRDAVRALRGTVLRREVYARDGGVRADRPYSVDELVYGLREEDVPAANAPPRPRVFFPHLLAERRTQWERGDDPRTRAEIRDDYDAFGQARQRTTVALPRRSARRDAVDETEVLAVHDRTEFAVPDAGLYVHDRASHRRTFALRQPGGVNEAAPADLAAVTRDGVAAAAGVHRRFRDALDPWAAGQPLPAEVRLLRHDVHHYDGGPAQAFLGRAPGLVGPYGALTRSETLAFTDGELDAAYGAARPAYLGGQGDLPPGAPAGFGAALGYRLEPDAVSGHHHGFYVDTRRLRFDFHAGAPGSRGLALGAEDALGHATVVVPDAYGLLPAETRDAAGLVTRAVYDYRVLQPSEVVDPNGNRALYTFTPLGLLETVAVKGPVGTDEGDVARPSVRFEHAFRAFMDSPPAARQPISVRTVRQLHHDTELDMPLPARDATAESIEYADGFGRVLQKRARAETVTFGAAPLADGVLSADPAGDAAHDVVGVENADAQAPRVAVSGAQTYDNKGRVVEAFGPFFAAGWAYAPPPAGALARKVELRYDALGRVVHTIQPDGSEERVVQGVPPALDQPEAFAPTPWETQAYDANDNAGRTNPVAADAYRHHWDTPTSRRLDALGRTLEVVERTRAAAPAGQPVEVLRTRAAYDVQGRLSSVSDPLGRVVRRQVWDLRGLCLRAEGLDSGARWTVFDALGRPVEERDASGGVVLHLRDVLGRPRERWARDSAGQPLTLRERLDYGDAGDPAQPAAQRAAQRAANRLGRVHQHYDEAGRLTFERYDFKGNVLERSRRVVADAHLLAVLAAPGPVASYRVDWRPPLGTAIEDHAAAVLEAADYRTSSTFDALGRPKTVTCPQDVLGARKVLRPRYDAAGSLERVEVDGDVLVERIAYDAKGQRTLIAYGNGLMTRYAYDAKLQLVRLRTEAFQSPAPHTYHPAGPLLQDSVLTRDLAGHVLATVDRVPGCGVVNHPDALAVPAGDPIAPLLAAGDALIRRFTYDPLYRLISATGREAAQIPAPRPWTDAPRHGFNGANHGPPDQGNAAHLTTPYTERYAYDPAGNLVSLQHSGPAQPGWTRHFGMGGLAPDQWLQEWQGHWNAGPWPAPPGNRLTHVADGAPPVPATHQFDARGNLLAENLDRHFEWDHAGRLRAFRVQPPAGPASVHAQYLYDADGYRVKKLVRRGPADYDVTVQADRFFEHHRRVRPNDVRENDTVHVMDDRSRVATLRVGDAFPGDGAPAARVRYHLGDGLGHGALVVGGADTAAQAFLNREEYFPYGETSLGSFARKRYRFGARERDEESGLAHHHARYYAGWLGRWVSCDPIGLAGGLNPYVAFADDPIGWRDPTGTQPQATPDMTFRERDRREPKRVLAPSERGTFAQEERELEEAFHTRAPKRTTTASGRTVFEPSLRVFTFQPENAPGFIVLGPRTSPDRLQEALDRLKPEPAAVPEGLRGRGQEDAGEGSIDIGPLKVPRLRSLPPPRRIEPPPRPIPDEKPKAEPVPLVDRVVQQVFVRILTWKQRKEGTGGPWTLVRTVVAPVRADVGTSTLTATLSETSQPFFSLESSETAELQEVLRPYDRSTLDPVFLISLPTVEEVRRMLQRGPQVIRLP
jgi:RHS repeat-associated protein